MSAARAALRRAKREVQYVVDPRTVRRKVYVGQGAVDALGKRADAEIVTATLRRYPPKRRFTA